MRSILKLVPILFLSFLMTACSNDTKTDKEQTASADAHQHAYRCPMNCENGKTYDKPGRCPVCGMKLEHYDGGEDNGLSYKMQYASNPPQLTAGQPGVITIIPKVVGKDAESVALDVQHEKKIHMIVVSDDLSYFEHIHPDYQSDGSYQIKVLGKGQGYSSGAGKNETSFEHGGKYVIYADYKPTGGAHQVEKIPVQVGGTNKPTVTFKEEKLAGYSGKYSVQLQAEGAKLITGTQMHIAGTVIKDGKEIDANTLENYLGAKAHMVVISLNEKEYLHVHPDVAGGKFDLHTTFKMPGIYRGWIQFQAEGKVHTIDFTFRVAEGSAADKEKAKAGHVTDAAMKDEHAGH